MSTRVFLVCVLIAAAGCASGGKLPIHGDWRVTSFHGPDPDATPPIGTIAVVGTSATLSRSEIRLGLDRCSRPTFTPRTLTAAEFTAEFKLQPSQVGLAGDAIQAFDLACGDGRTLDYKTLFVKDADTLIVPREGTFYEMTRRDLTRRAERRR